MSEQKQYIHCRTCDDDRLAVIKRGEDLTVECEICGQTVLPYGKVKFVSLVVAAPKADDPAAEGDRNGVTLLDDAACRKIITNARDGDGGGDGG